MQAQRRRPGHADHGLDREGRNDRVRKSNPGVETAGARMDPDDQDSTVRKVENPIARLELWIQLEVAGRTEEERCLWLRGGDIELSTMQTAQIYR